MPGAIFESLAEPVQRWIWEQGWIELRAFQAEAMSAVMQGGDVLIAAPTASGKTEAAFLPLASRVSLAGPRSGFALLYISPLKALINDQFRRLEPLFEALEMPVHRWHGDVAASRKAAARKNPSGLVLITPESLEALFIRRGREVVQLFGGLDAVVIDELHAFIGTERVMQLASLLTRLEAAIGRRLDRIGLSATLGDLRLAADALRVGEGADVAIVEGTGSTALRAQVRGYWREPIGQTIYWKRKIADHLFETLRLGKNLIFGGSRDNVEELADLLRVRTEQEGLPEAFFPHHGSLSREHREFVEAKVKAEGIPASAICTSTLELGIDIGAIDSVAQIGPPFTVSSLRQRLGRSGRRPGKPAILRVYVDEPRPGVGSSLLDDLNLKLIQSIAMVRLLIERWCEAPTSTGLHLSVLTHQTMSIIAERGGSRAGTLYERLCRQGPFRTVSASVFAEVLRAISRPQAGLVEQANDGTLLLGPVGEQLVEQFDFYAVFQSPEEYRVTVGGRTIGQLPMEHARAAGDLILLAGRRWRILEIDETAKLILVEPSPGAAPPGFNGSWGGVHDRVAIEMRAVLDGDDVPAFLDPTAIEMLAAARRAYTRVHGAAVQWAYGGEEVLILPWLGHRKMRTLAGALSARDVPAELDGMSIGLKRKPETLDAVRQIQAAPPSAAEIAIHLQPKASEKYHPYLTEQLLNLEIASSVVDLARFEEVLAGVVIALAEALENADQR